MEDHRLDRADEVVREEEKTGFQWGRMAAWGGLLALLVILALMLNRSQKGPVQVGDQVPDFEIETFDGEVIRLSEHRGKVVVLNFWASWCKPCEQEAEDMETAWQYYQERGDVLFLGVDYVDTEPEAMGYINKFNISYPNGADLGTKISQAFRIKGVPETYIIDQEGILRSFQLGPFMSLSQIKGKIDPLLTP